MEKLIVTVAPSSNFHGKEANPAIPYTPEEIVDSAYESWNEGASVVHIHARDKNGVPTNAPEFYQEIDSLIREKKCDLIIQHSMAPANTPKLLTEGGLADIDEGVRASQTTPPPEMVSMEASPIMLHIGQKPIFIGWNKLWAEKVATDLRERGIKPEFEIADASNLEDIYYLIEKGCLEKPYSMSFVMNMYRMISGGVRYTPDRLMHVVSLLPPDTKFSVLGVGYPATFQATTLSILLGGNVRIGFEDNIYSKKDVLAKSSAELVAMIVRIARDLGREIASPEEARQILNIPSLKL